MGMVALRADGVIRLWRVGGRRGIWSLSIDGMYDFSSKLKFRKLNHPTSTAFSPAESTLGVMITRTLSWPSTAEYRMMKLKKKK